MANVLKQKVAYLRDAPRPQPEPVQQILIGKIQPLGLGTVRSAIVKVPVDVPVYFDTIGSAGDEHEFKKHGGPERAVHQYSAQHYPSWAKDNPSKSHLFKLGGFGENLTATNLTEENVCVGDVFRLGKEVLLAVDEPRVPCHKLNLRFEWPDILKRVQRTGRVGWYMRVKQTGYASTGDTLTLIKRPIPRWSCMNVHRVLNGKSVPLELVEQLAELPALSSYSVEIAQSRLETSSRAYTLTSTRMITPRVKELSFTLKPPQTVKCPDFRPYAHARIKFGPNLNIARSYSIVSGNLSQFTLGVALDDNSRGGSKYLHKCISIGDEITMAAGYDAAHAKSDRKATDSSLFQIKNRLVIIGGIGVTAFLPAIAQWSEQKRPFEVHYAVRGMDEAAYADLLPADKTTIYARSRKERLTPSSIIPSDPALTPHTRIFACGPPRLMADIQYFTTQLGYHPHLLHFESFGATAGGPAEDPFTVEASDPDTGKRSTLEVGADHSLLSVLNDAGFEVDNSCQAGSCGVCKVVVKEGKVEHRGVALEDDEREGAMLTCVDRGKGKLKIEID